MVATIPALEAKPLRAGRNHKRPTGSWFRPIARLLFTYVTLIAVSAFIMLPLGWMLTVALKGDDSVVYTTPPQWYPTTEWNWDNFTRALLSSENPFGIYLLNTMWIEIFVVLGTVISSAVVAYPFARMKFRGSGWLFTVLILTMLIPWQGLMIPQFQVFKALGMYGTYLPLIIPSFTGSAFFIFLIRQYMRTIPKELEDAARIDGASEFRIFWSIILPLSRPALTVCAVLTFLGTWNDLLGPVIYLNRQEDFTLAVGLANFVSARDPQLNLLMAATLVTIVPMLLLYFVAQRHLIGGIASIGLKG